MLQKWGSYFYLALITVFGSKRRDEAVLPRAVRAMPGNVGSWEGS